MWKLVSVLSLAVNMVVAALFAAGVFVCAPSGGEKYLPTQADMKFIDRTVAMYDSFVRSRTNDSVPIEEAYRICFGQAKRALEAEDDALGFWSSLFPDSTFLTGYMRELVSNYALRNDLVVADYEIDSSHASYWRLSLNYPVFMNFIKNALRGRAVWEPQIESIEAAGDITPTFYTSMALNYEQIDFGNKIERFILALGYSKVYLPFADDFVLKMDLAKNDSIRRAKLEKHDYNRSN